MSAVLDCLLRRGVPAVLPVRERSGAALPGRRVTASPWACVLLVALLAAAAGCHDVGDVKVTSLSFVGNNAFSGARLKGLLATRASGWLPWSPRHYFDRKEFDADLARLVAFYRDRGYPSARVTDIATSFNAERTAVSVALTIAEGTPVTVEAVDWIGFESLVGAERQRLDAAPIVVGVVRDQDQVRAARDLGARLLRESGYPRAEVAVAESPGSTTTTVRLTFRAAPGPRMAFGEVTITGLENVDEGVVRRELAFRPGDPYRASQVIRTQRRLSRLQLFEFANVDDRLRDTDAALTAVPVRIIVAEAPPRRLEIGVGYGSEERARATVSWKHLRFFGGARQATVDAKWSALDRGVSVGLVEPFLFRPGVSFRLQGQLWHTEELAYSSDVAGGRATVVTRFDRRAVDGTREVPRLEARFSYINEFVDSGIKEDAEGDLPSREELIALGLDPDTGRTRGTLGGVQFEFERAALDDALDPRRGTHASARILHAGPWLGGTYRFDELVLEGRAYIPLSRSVGIATRGRFGTLAAVDDAAVPFGARYFLGGSHSLRGWGRFQVSPLSEDGLPVGGRSQFELATELRFPLARRLGGAVFVDLGNVWSDDWTIQFRDLRSDFGAGVRYLTPVGALRADIGRQLSQIDGLVIDGEPEKRSWRIHFSIGQVF